MDKYEDFKAILPDWVNPANFELYKMRHTAEHVLHMAVTELFPEIRRAMGPPIQDGFYFDLDPNSAVITENDLPRIEEKMLEIQNRSLPMVREEISIDRALELFKDNPYKQEWINEFKNEGKTLTVYWTGDPKSNPNADPDLCKGPHIDNIRDIGFFKLLSIAGAYWRGDEKNKMLTRIYATTFPTKEGLDKHLWQIEEAKKRDHRKLGKELDLFLFSDLVGPGLPMWTPKGTVFRNQLDDFVWSLRKAKGYSKVSIPHITKRDLYETSGHWKKYSNDLFKIQTREGHEFAMKPMNCPHHTQIYDHIKRSYRDLPQRYAETTMVYRDEQSGELSGLSRVRCITQDDAHVFCRHNQIEQEINSVWDIIDNFYSVFGFELKARLSLHDPDKFENYLGTPEMWEKNENYLREVAKSRNVQYFEKHGEAAFYGPKIDFMAYDSIGREWQVATIQLDTNMPERFELDCTNEEGQKERIVMLHVAIMGSIERFSSVIIEHFAGAFPAWLSPDQVMIIPISAEQNDYADKIKLDLEELGIRVVNNTKDDMMQSKIKDAQEQKIPYMLVVGKREAENGTVSVRYRDRKDNLVLSFEEFKEKISENIKNRTIDIHFE